MTEAERARSMKRSPSWERLPWESLRWMTGPRSARASSRGEFRPPALSEPGVSLSTHRAPIIRPQGRAPAFQ